jgi:hypothetical protein
MTVHRSLLEDLLLVSLNLHVLEAKTVNETTDQTTEKAWARSLINDSGWCLNNYNIRFVSFSNGHTYQLGMGHMDEGTIEQQVPQQQRKQELREWTSFWMNVVEFDWKIEFGVMNQVVGQNQDRSGLPLLIDLELHWNDVTGEELWLIRHILDQTWS